MTTQIVNQKQNENLNLEGFKFAAGIDPSQIIKEEIYLINPNKEWEKWGHVHWEMIGRNHRAVWDKIGWKYWKQKNFETGDMEFKKLWPDKMPFYPMEEIEYQANELYKAIRERQLNQWMEANRARGIALKNDQIKDNEALVRELEGTNFQIVNTYHSHGDFTNYWEVLSDRFDKIQGSYRKDDVVQIGFIMRNGYNTGIALGFDFFTKALICENGAVAKGADLGSIAIKHIGSYENMRDRFLQALPYAIQKGQQLVKYYQNAAHHKLSNEIAKTFFKNLSFLSDQHFPDYFGIDSELRKKDPKKVDKIVNVTATGKNLTVWEVFNDFTSDLWPGSKHNQNREKKSRMQFSGVRNSEINLHNALMQTIKVKA